VKAALNCTSYSDFPACDINETLFCEQENYVTKCYPNNTFNNTPHMLENQVPECGFTVCDIPEIVMAYAEDPVLSNYQYNIPIKFIWFDHIDEFGTCNGCESICYNSGNSPYVCPKSLFVDSTDGYYKYMNESYLITALNTTNSFFTSVGLDFKFSLAAKEALVFPWFPDVNGQYIPNYSPYYFCDGDILGLPTDAFNLFNSSIIDRGYLNIGIFPATVDNASPQGKSPFFWKLNQQNRDKMILLDSKFHESNVMSHEIGHYFGLFHVNGVINAHCSEYGRNGMVFGDLVADTNFSLDELDASVYDTSGEFNLTQYLQNCTSKYTAGCPTPPYRNIMSYSPEYLRTELTNLQKARMRCYADLMNTNFCSNRAVNSSSIVPLPVNITVSGSESTIMWVTPIGIPQVSSYSSQYEIEYTTTGGNTSVKTTIQDQLTKAYNITVKGTVNSASVRLIMIIDGIEYPSDWSSRYIVNVQSVKGSPRYYVSFADKVASHSLIVIVLIVALATLIII
jgi:hypothetical protein